MRLAAFTDYGLRILMRLADAPERRFSTAELATQFRVSQHHLTKVVQDLARGGFITTQRGSGGGISLARDSDTIRLGEVVRYLERRFALVECFQTDGGECVLEPRCRLKARLASAREAFFKDLDRSTIADCTWRDGAAA
ncbi:RrF2 family transcriptional regulator [Pontibaca salina]|uniref:Rrf2 family transcriptional regulator n=1 Tax=Pontibaca salina TaxID=2795731 RepID=A0A934HSJ2_9RHOB|nr:Rrf2 family transcriptional regulator [Pontibaca salina]MBI6628824.1 Rrf2 family transcriptional regulator [Pontibaca salina]